MSGIKLEIREYNNTELAEWFGIKSKSFRDTKKKKLEELKDFAEFEELPKGKILITAIKYPIYIKKKSKLYEYYRQEVPKHWRKNEVDTCARVAAAICKNNKDLKLSTGEEYTRFVRNELWGIPAHHYQGECYYVLAKMYRHPTDKSQNRYETLTEEEREIYDAVHDQVYNRREETQNKVFLRELVKTGELTREQVYEILMDEGKYVHFIRAVSDKLHCDWIVMGTVVIENDKVYIKFEEIE